ncbi:hypothetical protein [uncultured Helicobacter sp.]|uniref:hypothetical protein n=1 Tax=uncultured Helicobacter sp. TaxID=175537 RepID=UPI002604AD6A|nr:hypothetical protein [uncultured Helicobacter sp.]
MTKQELDEVLEGLNLTRKRFCEKLGINYMTFNNNWGTKTPIPQYAISWLELYKTAQIYEKILEIKNIKIRESKGSNFTRKDFDERLKELHLTRKNFSEMAGVRYANLSHWDCKYPTPLWVENWLNAYDYAEKFKRLEIQL